MGKKHRFQVEKFQVNPDQKLNLAKISSAAGNEFDSRVHGEDSLADDVSALQEAQNHLYADDR